MSDLAQACFYIMTSSNLGILVHTMTLDFLSRVIGDRLLLLTDARRGERGSIDTHTRMGTVCVMRSWSWMVSCRHVPIIIIAVKSGRVVEIRNRLLGRMTVLNKIWLILPQ